MKTEKARMLKKIVTFMCAITLICTIISIPIGANTVNGENQTIISLSPKNDGTHHRTTKPMYLKNVQSKLDQYEHGSLIEQSYEIVSSYMFDSYVISVNACDGITLESPSTINLTENDSKTFTIRFRITDDNFFTDKITVNLSSYLNEDSVAIFEASSTIHCLKTGNYNYISLISRDSLAVYSDELAEIIYAENKEGEHIEVFTTNSTANSARSLSPITISGTINWKDSNGNAHPASNLTVELYDYYGDILLGTTTTNTSGYYTKSIVPESSETTIYAKIKTSGLNIDVVDPSTSQTYNYATGGADDLQPGASATISYTFKQQNDLGKAASVHQAMEMANRYMYELEGTYMGSITVTYPTEPTSYGLGGIFVSADDAFDWDVLQHEYGHFVADIFRIDNSLGGEHSAHQNLIDLNGKGTGIEFAWSEGVATYFAIKLQEEMGAASLNIPNVGDSCYSDTDDITLTLDIETTYYQYIDESENIECLDLLLGEGNEAVVAGILYDLTDPTDSADYDHVYYDDYTIWSIIIAEQCTTLSDFIQAFYGLYSVSEAIDLGVTLEYFRVAAQLNDPLMINTDTPFFSWIGNGGGETAASTNNSFTLVFYNSSYQQIKEIAITDTTRSYIQLTKSQWDEIKSLAGSNTFYCCIRSSQTNTPSTGPYLSSAKTITLS